MAEMIESPLLAVALARRVDERQILGLAAGEEILSFAGHEEVLQRHGDLLGEADADEAAGRDRVAVADQANSFRGRHNLALFAGAQRGEKWRRGWSCMAVTLNELGDCDPAMRSPVGSKRA